MPFSRSYAEKLNSPISSDQFLMEPMSAMHAGSFFNPMQNQTIYHWISSAPPKSITQLETWWKERESRRSPDGNEAWLNWAVKRIVDGAYVGTIDCEIDSTNVAINVGYLFFPEFWGLGYASEALRAVTVHLAKQGITEMHATVTLGNVASYRVLEKAGFIRTRILPDNDIIRGLKYDDVEYILTAQAIFLSEEDLASQSTDNHMTIKKLVEP